MDFLQQFLDDMAAHGNEPANAGDIVPTGGEWKRYDIAAGKPRNSLGYYRLTIDGDFAMGSHGNRRDGETHNWHSKASRKWTDEEKAAFKQRIKDAEAARAVERQKQEDDAADRAKAMWKEAVPVTQHPYLTAKNIDAHGAKLHPSEGLLVPIYNGRLCNVQRISEDGEKKFLWQAKIKGCYYPIATAEDDKSVVVICEGFATGASIRQATGYPVAVAFNASNLLPVSKVMRSKYPDAAIIIAADNDQWTEVGGKLHNTGLIAGQQAAVAVQGFCVFPEFDAEDESKPTDFNDAAQLLGLQYVKDRIAQAHIAPVNGERGGNTEACHAAESVVQPSPPLPVKKDWSEALVWKNERAGQLDPKCSMHNGIVFLRDSEEFAGKLVYDEFRAAEYVVMPLPWEDAKGFSAREVQDFDITMFRAQFEPRGVKLGAADMRSAIEVAARARTQNPIKDHLSSLKWDGKPRLDTWLTYYVGAESQPAEYLAKVGSCWLIAAVKRIFEPGAPFHHMLVLEGGQGAKKSSTLEALATFEIDGVKDSYFTDRLSFAHTEKPDVAAMLRGNIIVEFQELSGLSKGDNNKVKQWITQTHDEWRKPHAQKATRFPRQYVLAGTTNDSGTWLTDPTGGRRFWPVLVGSNIDIDSLKKDRSQLWAEAVYRYKQGELWYINDTDPVYKIAEGEQSARYSADPLEDKIMLWLALKDDVTVGEIMDSKSAIGDWPDSLKDRRLANRIGSILRANGWDCVRKRRNGRTAVVWVRGAKAEA